MNSITTGLQSGYYLVKSVYQGDDKVRITVVKRFHEADKGDFKQQWFTRRYFKRVFPGLSERYSI